MIRHADAADARVNANVERDGLLHFGSDFVRDGTETSVDHGEDVAGDGVREVLFIEGAEKQDGFAGASVAKRKGFVKFDDSEAEDFGLRFEKLSDVGDAHAVAVVLDDCQDGARGNATRDFSDVVAKVFAMDFDPGIEGGVL